MKAIVLYLTATAFIFLASCKKPENNVTPSPVVTKSWAMSATIGANNFETDSTTGFISKDSVSGVTSIVVGAVNIAGDTAIAVGVVFGIAPGNYDLAAGQESDVAMAIGNNNLYRNVSGTLYIGQNTGKILEGIVNATMKETQGNEMGKTLSIANCHFKISYK